MSKFLAATWLFVGFGANVFPKPTSAAKLRSQAAKPPAGTGGVDIRILAVGESGTGKSTIGNFFLNGCSDRPFKTSPGVLSCTKKEQCVVGHTDVPGLPDTKPKKENLTFPDVPGLPDTKPKKENLTFRDVPGLPDTDPNETKKFYDIVVKAAREKLSAILFVFRKGKIDYNAYRRAKLLFREIGQANVLKILVINDHTNYSWGQKPNQEEYEIQAKEIKRITGLEFTMEYYMTSNTMPEKLKLMANAIRGFPAMPSPYLRTFDEMSAHVAELTKSKNYEEALVTEQREQIDRVKKKLKDLRITRDFNLEQAEKCAWSWWTIVSLGTSYAGAAVFLSAAAVQALTINGTIAELENLEEQYCDRNLKKAVAEFEDAIGEFGELERAVEHGSQEEVARRRLEAVRIKDDQPI